MDTNQTELKHRETGSTKKNENESEMEQVNNKSDTTTSAASQTKDEYFNALRAWLQQVQLQQIAYTYFPYYLSSNLQPNLNNVFISPMPFLPAQYPTFSPSSAFVTQTNFPNGVNGNAANTPDQLNQLNQLNRPPIFANNFIQPNRNNYIDNIRENMQILHQNGGYEYVIAPIWKRFLAEAIDVCIIIILISLIDCD